MALLSLAASFTYMHMRMDMPCALTGEASPRTLGLWSGVSVSAVTDTHRLRARGGLRPVYAATLYARHAVSVIARGLAVGFLPCASPDTMGYRYRGYATVLRLDIIIVRLIWCYEAKCV